MDMQAAIHTVPRDLGQELPIQTVPQDEPVQAHEPEAMQDLLAPAREPTGAMLRLLRHRDPECRFPGCGPGPT
jgi:hypothetical protein